MSEFMIYIGPHWMDSLSQAEVDRRSAEDPLFADKYLRHWKPGDITQDFPDGILWDTKAGRWKEFCTSPVCAMLRVTTAPAQGKAIYLRNTREKIMTVTKERYDEDPKLGRVFAEVPAIQREFLSAEWDAKQGKVIDIPMVEIKGQAWYVTSNSRWKLDMDHLPAKVKESLEKERRMILTKAEFEAVLIDKNG